MLKIIYKEGQLIDKTPFIFISELPPVKSPGGSIIRWVLIKCPCGKTFKNRLGALKKRRCKDCGCGIVSGIKRHGLTYTQEKVRNVWKNAKARCYSPTHPRYSLYGARGITMYPEWVHDLEAFYNYVTQLPHYGEPGRSLDRRDNNGNYEPGNLRWATQKEQVHNSRKYHNE